jgi:cyclophilin family peptidyl-prolyl cis-trans isomerase
LLSGVKIDESMKFLRLITIGILATSLSVVAFAQDAKLIFKIENRGEFVITLNSKAAPKTCAHIQSLAEKGFYDGLRFHRSEKKPKPFLVQVGDPSTKDSVEDGRAYKGGSGAKIPFELNDLQNELGAVGLASPPDDKDAGDSQFYILLSPARFLNGKYTVFGKITSGIDTIQKIEVGDKIVSVRVQKG